jgi:hypothetical protein
MEKCWGQRVRVETWARHWVRIHDCIIATCPDAMNGWMIASVYPVASPPHVVGTVVVSPSRGVVVVWAVVVVSFVLGANRGGRIGRRPANSPICTRHECGTVAAP